MLDRINSCILTTWLCCHCCCLPWRRCLSRRFNTPYDDVAASCAIACFSPPQAQRSWDRLRPRMRMGLLVGLSCCSPVQEKNLSLHTDGHGSSTKLTALLGWHHRPVQPAKRYAMRMRFFFPLFHRPSRTTSFSSYWVAIGNLPDKYRIKDHIKGTLVILGAKFRSRTMPKFCKADLQTVYRRPGAGRGVPVDVDAANQPFAHPIQHKLMRPPYRILQRTTCKSHQVAQMHIPISRCCGPADINLYHSFG